MKLEILGGVEQDGRMAVFFSYRIFTSTNYTDDVVNVQFLWMITCDKICVVKAEIRHFR